MEQPYGPPPVRQGYNLALASLITGIGILILGCCIPFVGILGVVAIILGTMALKASAADEAYGQTDSSKTMAIIGIVLGAFAVLYGIGSGIWLIVFARNMMPHFPGMPGGPPPNFQ